MRSRLVPLIGLCSMLLAAPAVAQPAAKTTPPPSVIPHSTWQAKPPLGVPADAARRNKRAGDSLSFRELTVTVLQTLVDSSGTKPVDVARVKLATTGGAKSATEERVIREATAFNWRGCHVAVVAVYGPGELGAGLVALEVATITSLPPNIASSVVAGGADSRLRIPHTITHVTLHHTGDSKPLTRADDPAQRLRNLQSWGASDRNWWDVPYHFLLGLDGRVFEGRNRHFQGETNTTYDPGGHFLISMIGNDDVQEPNEGQLAAIADLMASALKTNDLSMDRIGGHYNPAETGCPGKYLRRYPEDGTLRRMVQQRLTTQ